MATTFPKNPTDGMIFEAVPGLFYQYSARENCWIRVDGLNALGLATPTQDGLMSPEDFNKLNGLLIPPPQSTIKGDECKVAYTHGQVGMTSTDDSLSVLPTLQLTNNSGNAGVIDEPWALHPNTAGYDFRLDVNKILDAMKANGNFTQVKIQGRQGPKGNPGSNGIDKLETGPSGPAGPDGQNAPYDGNVSSDPTTFVLADDTSNRAIVNITTDTANGNFLVATRANIGNPNACPNEVEPKAITSPLVLAISKQENAMVRTLQSTNDCVNPCTICVSTLHYLNLEIILDAFFERFQELVIQLKTQKEELAASWLRTLINVFTDQKFALCCALENCKSAQRNNQERQYLESQRIAAANADQQLIIDGVNDRTVVNPDADKTCPVDVVTQVRRGVGCDCVLQYTLDGKLHATDPRSLFLERPPALVDFRTTTPFQTDRVGILDVHTELQKSSISVLVNSDETVKATRTIIVQTGIKPPSQAKMISDWKMTIANVSAVNSPPRPLVSQYAINASVIQNGQTVATFSTSGGLADFPEQTITLQPVDGNVQNVDPATEIELIISIDTTTTFSKSETASFYAVDYTLGPVHLTGTSPAVNSDIILQPDWGFDNWTCDGVGVNTGSGFMALTLPPGDYIAEIIDCCVDTINTRHLWRGVAAIEYNGVREVTGGGGTITPDTTFSERQVAMFADMGSFSNNGDARIAYLGNTIEFNHQGGQIRSWIVDPDSNPANNDGQMVICIRPKKCYESIGSGSVPADSNAIFVYKDTIDPMNLLGIIFPFNGTLSAAANYGYGLGSVDAFAPRDGTHVGPNHGFNRAKSFFCHGPDGLTFYTVHGGTNLPITNTINMAFATVGNSVNTTLRVADDPVEVQQTSVDPDNYNCNWVIGTFGSDGLAFGPLDPPSDGAGWQITASPNNLGTEQFWEAVSADGNVFTLAFNSSGIGKSISQGGIVFTPVRTGCVMPFKQIQWLERGHRTGAACSCVVTIEGQQYIISKRSIGTDITCGGGESLNNPCIAQYISTGAGHPAIAWPTVNGQEFLGIPTSGSHGFVFDQAFSDKVLAEMRAGRMTNVHGDPVTNIPFVIVPTAT